LNKPELCQNWALEANQVKNLALTENFSEMKNFLQKIGSNREIADSRLLIIFKNLGISFILYLLYAESTARSM
jgi:hypothetical protein